MKRKLLLTLLITATLFSSCKDNNAQTLYTDDGATHVAETTAVPKTTAAPQTTSVPETTAAPATVDPTPWEHYDVAAYGGLDIDLTLWRPGYDAPCGIWGSLPEYFAEEPTVETLAGDVFSHYNGFYNIYTWDGFTAKVYVPEGAEGVFYSLYEIYTDREDIYTYRGIHVGSTLEEVKEAYKGEMPVQEVTNGRIEYQDPEYWGSYAPHLYFYIEQDVVVAMELKYSMQGISKTFVQFDGSVFVLNMDKAKGRSSIGEIYSVAYDNSLDCFHPEGEGMQIKEIYETDAYIFANVKYDCVYDVLVYEKDAKQASWLSGAESFQTYHADKIATLRQYYTDANDETAAFPYIENRILSISPDEKYALVEKMAGEGFESLAVEYYVCRLDTSEMTYLFDGFTTECGISWLEDAFAWIDENTLRIASWTDRYDDLYRSESVRKAEVFEVYLSENAVTVKESDAQYDHSAKAWIEGTEQPVEDWMFKFETPGYDAWADIDGEYAIWEFTKNADGEFALTYSEGDVLCIPYVTIGASEIVYATQQTIWAPALEIGTPHTLQAHEEIRALFQLDTKGGQSFGEPYSDPYNADGIYADMFAKYCKSAPEAAELLRESAGKLRDILRVWYNGEAVDGIGIAPPSYYFIRERTREWRFIFSKSYALADVNTVRIELRIPDTLSDAQ